MTAVGGSTPLELQHPGLAGVVHSLSTAHNMQCLVVSQAAVALAA